jgi:hypothetical protein
MMSVSSCAPTDVGTWRGGRAVQCTGLENRRPQGLVGSNPTPSVLKNLRCSGCPYMVGSPSRSNPRAFRRNAPSGFEPSGRRGSPAKRTVPLTRETTARSAVHPPQPSGSDWLPSGDLTQAGSSNRQSRWHLSWQVRLGQPSPTVSASGQHLGQAAVFHRRQD